MGAFTGGLTYRQYYVNDPLPAGWKDRFHQGIAQKAFKEIDVNSADGEERAVGWCSPHFPLDTDIQQEMYLFNEYIVLAMRIDTLTVPGTQLRIYAESAARKVMLEQKRESLTRYERAELKEQVKADLRRKIMPTIKTVDMVWNWQEGVVRFFAGNNKVNEEFMELFEETFGLLLTPDSAYTAAVFAGIGLTKDELKALESVEPTGTFADADTAFAAMKEG